MTIQEIKWIRALLKKGTATTDELSKCEKLIKNSAHELLDALEWRIRHRQTRDTASETVSFEDVCGIEIKCKHQRVQEIMRGSYEDITSGPYLRKGWSALGIIGDKIVLQRLKPCDLCEKV